MNHELASHVRRIRNSEPLFLEGVRMVCRDAKRARRARLMRKLAWWMLIPTAVVMYAWEFRALWHPFVMHLPN